MKFQNEYTDSPAFSDTKPQHFAFVGSIPFGNKLPVRETPQVYCWNLCSRANCVTKRKLKLEFKKTKNKKKHKLQVGVKRQVNNKGVCLLHTPPPSTTLTSSTAETVLRQSLILDWNVEVPGEDKSSFVRITKSETLIRSGMFRAKRVRQSVKRKVRQSYTRACKSHLKWKKKKKGNSTVTPSFLCGNWKNI